MDVPDVEIDEAEEEISGEGEAVGDGDEQQSVNFSDPDFDSSEISSGSVESDPTVDDIDSSDELLVASSGTPTETISLLKAQDEDRAFVVERKFGQKKKQTLKRLGAYGEELDVTPSKSEDFTDSGSYFTESDIFDEDGELIRRGRRRRRYGQGSSSDVTEPTKYFTSSATHLKRHNELMRDWFEKNLDMLIQKQDQAVEAVKLEYLLQRKVITTSSRSKNSDDAVSASAAAVSASETIAYHNPFIHQTQASRRRIYNLIKY